MLPKSRSSVTTDAPFAAGGLGDFRVGVAAQPFLKDGLRIMPVGPQRFRHVVVQVLVDLESHHPTPGMKGMTVSRANSAA